MAKGGELLIWASHTAKLNSTQAQQSHFKSTFGVHFTEIILIYSQELNLLDFVAFFLAGGCDMVHKMVNHGFALPVL